MAMYMGYVRARCLCRAVHAPCYRAGDPALVGRASYPRPSSSRPRTIHGDEGGDDGRWPREAGVSITIGQDSGMIRIHDFVRMPFDQHKRPLADSAAAPRTAFTLTPCVLR